LQKFNLIFGIRLSAFREGWTLLAVPTLDLLKSRCLPTDDDNVRAWAFGWDVEFATNNLMIERIESYFKYQIKILASWHPAWHPAWHLGANIASSLASSLPSLLASCRADAT
jgi:hypothetical protein